MGFNQVNINIIDRQCMNNKKMYLLQVIGLAMPSAVFWFLYAIVLVTGMPSHEYVV